MQEIMRDYLDPIRNALNYHIFTLGEAHITPLSIFYLFFLTGLLFYLSYKLRNLVIDRLLTHTKLDEGARLAVGTISRYLILFIGFLVILQTIGINLTTLNVLAGAIGIGVGFGLQNVASNFISGLIILFERPVKVGDRIEVDGVDGKVMAVGARSTRIKTNDNVTIIVPNSKFITENVHNWSYKNNRIRFRIPVGVAYDSDIELVKRLLLEVASESKNVLLEPPPSVRLLEFGDNAINLELWAWSETQLHRKSVFRSDMNFAIWRKFRENNIEIPFPQRDLNIRGGELRVGKNGFAVIEREEDVSEDSYASNGKAN